MEYIRRAFNLSENHITKLQLIKAIEPDKSITYSEIMQEAIDLYWNINYKDKQLSDL